jgi:uncharacterized Zn-finger protein
MRYHKVSLGKPGLIKTFIKLRSFVSQGEVFTCDYENCGKQFVRKHVLNIHKKIHLNQKDYVCQYTGCSSRYHNNVGLRKHIYSVHQKLRVSFEKKIL